MTSKSNTLTKHGLTGNSGLNVDGFKDVVFHIAASYAAGDGKCFVDWFENGEIGWRRMTVKRATKEGRRIITCDKCSKPAISLDHYWPYYSDMNRCLDHALKK